jgi:hypothetical protein
VELVGIVLVIMSDVEAANFMALTPSSLCMGRSVKAGAANPAPRPAATPTPPAATGSFPRQAEGFDLDVAIEGAVGAAFAVAANVTGLKAFGVNQFSGGR